MVQNRERKTAIGTFSAETMEQAVAMVISGSSIREAAELHNVARNTLHRYVQKARNVPEGETAKLQPNYACRRVFSNDEEGTIKEYLINCSKMNYGLSRKKVRELAYEVALKNGRQVPDTWHGNKMAGEDWLYGFMKRNPSLSPKLLRAAASQDLLHSTNIIHKHFLQSSKRSTIDILLLLMDHVHSI